MNSNLQFPQTVPMFGSAIPDSINKELPGLLFMMVIDGEVEFHDGRGVSVRTLMLKSESARGTTFKERKST